MNKDELLAHIEKIQKNEKYKVSKALHKDYQYHQFTEDNEIINGQIPKYEDINGKTEGEEGYDPTTARIVLYNFKNGLITDDGIDPAIQCQGHWEYWKDGVITKVLCDYGEHTEIWENGVPVKINEGE